MKRGKTKFVSFLSNAFGVFSKHFQKSCFIQNRDSKLRGFGKLASGFFTSNDERGFLAYAAAGFAAALVILLLFYKLRTKDVQVMAQYNNGELNREDAEALLAEKYGPAGER